MTKQEEEALKYKEYPEGSGGKAIYDSLFLPFQEYLNKYFEKPYSMRKTSWQRWQTKYIEPAFEESRHEEMIKNFGYVSIDKYDFKSQYIIYNQLKEDDRLDNETRKFIGFIAGAGFFEKFNLDLEEWFKMENWINPTGNIEDWKGRTINDILSYAYGLNYLKVNLPQMSFWKR